MLQDFREFIARGNVIDLAVGVIMGAAFTGIINSLVKDIIMPPIGLITGGLDFSNKFLILKHPPGGGFFVPPADAVKAGATTWNYGNFIQPVIKFDIVALAVSLLVKGFNRM